MDTSFSVRVRGRLACFTRPELKVERMSYPVITPSAARGIFEAVLWKPAICWHIDRIAVLAPIQFTAFRRNEVNNRAAKPSASIIKNGGAVSAYYADEDRAQRNTVALRDVDYRIDAHFTMTDRAGAEDNPVKFVEMFRRRLASGQHFHQPYLGCREFVADVSPVSADDPPPINDSRDLGVMLWDIAFAQGTSGGGGGGANRPIFFVAQMKQGVIDVPPDEQAALATLHALAGAGGAA